MRHASVTFTCDICGNQRESANGELFVSWAEIDDRHLCNFCLHKVFDSPAHARVYDERIATMDESQELAWGLIANAYGGDWDQASVLSGWKAAAEKWRDAYHDGPPNVGHVQSDAKEEPLSDVEIDFRVLLKKYMDIVGLNEGVTFVPESADEYNVVDLTQEEFNALIAVEKAEPPLPYTTPEESAIRNSLQDLAKG